MTALHDARWAGGGGYRSPIEVSDALQIFSRASQKVPTSFTTARPSRNTRSPRNLAIPRASVSQKLGSGGGIRCFATRELRSLPRRPPGYERGPGAGVSQCCWDTRELVVPRGGAIWNILRQVPYRSIYTRAGVLRPTTGRDSAGVSAVPPERKEGTGRLAPSKSLQPCNFFTRAVWPTLAGGSIDTSNGAA